MIGPIVLVETAAGVQIKSCQVEDSAKHVPRPQAKISTDQSIESARTEATTYRGEVHGPGRVNTPTSSQSTPEIPRRLPKTRKRIMRFDPDPQSSSSIAMLPREYSGPANGRGSRCHLQHRSTMSSRHLIKCPE